MESSQFGDESVQAILKFPTEYPGFDVYGSCDGLLLIGDYVGVQYLANPSTREFRKLPPSPFKLHSWKFLNFYGFGYDSQSHDFKVVSISRYRESADIVSLYALKTNSWKKIENSPYGHSVMGDNSGVLVSGALHWFARTSTGTDILAVDLADEKIRTIPTLDCTGFELVVHGGCLCVSAKWYDNSRADFWVMKEYGVGVHYSLVNPSTREFRKLPPSPFPLHPRKSFNVVNGFGYDSQSDDFKVVRISHYQESADNVVNLYALRTNSWKKNDNSPYDHSGIGPKSGVLVSGALHWFARTSTSKVILTLDLADEKFRSIPTLDCMGFNLIVLGGCLCVSGKRYDDSLVRVTYDRFDNYWKPWSSSRADRVLFQVNNKMLVLFDPQEEKSKELVVHGIPTDFVAGTYVESLVSPNRQC
ncbi:hypothetical protein RHGRI_013384 [Rhododendron griersonianum]|uniref:F-box associated beta-propeller type 3 domain-containing protein n=1 Tax=Rhododendron griersonianum TaxID=479676 RepID=A0AAV6K5N4_9ERIC|nr:hypothetical protein RHGRI_013384 [Rhododendron griersonianum]